MLADHIESAKKVFKTICRELDKIECTYYKNENRLSITTDSRCDNVYIGIRITVNICEPVVSLRVHIPLTVPEYAKVDISRAVLLINHNIVDGAFKFDPITCEVSFNTECVYADSSINEEVFEYMLSISCGTVDNLYIDLRDLSQGIITFNEFSEKLANRWWGR